eukprot:1664147-Rhodomonas_salina.2
MASAKEEAPTGPIMNSCLPSQPPSMPAFTVSVIPNVILNVHGLHHFQSSRTASLPMFTALVTPKVHTASSIPKNDSLHYSISSQPRSLRNKVEDQTAQLSPPHLHHHYYHVLAALNSISSQPQANADNHNTLSGREAKLKNAYQHNPHTQAPLGTP